MSVHSVPDQVREVNHAIRRARQTPTHILASQILVAAARRGDQPEILHTDPLDGTPLDPPSRAADLLPPTYRTVPGFVPDPSPRNRLPACPFPAPGAFLALLPPEPARRPLARCTARHFAEVDEWREARAFLGRCERDNERNIRDWWASQAPARPPLVDEPKVRRSRPLLAVTCARRTHDHVRIRHWHLTAPLQPREPREHAPRGRFANGYIIDEWHVGRRFEDRDLGIQVEEDPDRPGARRLVSPQFDGMAGFAGKEFEKLIKGEENNFRAAVNTFRLSGDLYAAPWQKEREYNRQYWDEPCYADDPRLKQPAYAGPVDRDQQRQDIRDQFREGREDLAYLKYAMWCSQKGNKPNDYRRYAYRVHQAELNLCDIAARYGFQVCPPPYSPHAEDIDLVTERRDTLVNLCKAEKVPIAEAMEGYAALTLALTSHGDNPDLVRACAGVLRARQYRDREKLEKAIIAYRAMQRLAA